MSNHYAPLKEDDQMTHAEDSNELESEPHDIPENTEKGGLSLLAGIAAARDESCMEEELREKSMRGVSLKRAAIDQSLNRKEGINRHTTEQPSGPLINKPTDLDKQAGVSTNHTTPSSPTPTESLFGRTFNFSPPSVEVIPPQEAGVLPVPPQPVSRPHLVQAQATRTSLNASLLNQRSSVPALSSFAGLPLLHLPHRAPTPTLSIDASLLNQLSSVPPLSPFAGLPHMPQAPSQPSSNLQTSLLGQLEMASLAQNVAGLPHVPQAPTVQSTHTTMLEQLAAAQAEQSSYSPHTQSTSDPMTAYLLQRLYATQNPSFPPIPPQDQSQLLQKLIQENMIKDQIIALLLSQQQQSTSAQMTAPANHLEMLLRSITPASNPERTYQVTSPVAASDYHLHYYGGAISNSDSATSGSLHAQRWMTRYEELKQFQQRQDFYPLCLS